MVVLCENAATVFLYRIDHALQYGHARLRGLPYLAGQYRVGLVIPSFFEKRVYFSINNEVG